MDKQQAQKIIEDTFESSFNRGTYIHFLRELLNSFDDEGARVNQGVRIPEKFQDHVEKIERIGKYTEENVETMLFIVYLKRETAIDRARTMQRNFVAWYLSQGEKDAALVAYVSPEQSDWRFSLVKMDYTFEKSKTGKMKVKEEFTPARRWSFLVGENEKSHTAQSRLVNILADDEEAPTLAELEKAFDIETVTKEFFLKYRELFLRTKEALDKVVKNNPNVKADFEAKGVDTVNFAKKLLGQIVFLYFLQKKGWFGVGRDDDWGAGSKHFLRSLFAKKHGNYRNFFNDILEPLFYEALRIDRSHDDDYYSRFNCKIPFLNGGLFDPIGNYDWVHTDIHLPEDLFSNTRKTGEGDEGEGILDVFDRYNFTVREDEPLEKEVAIDPELLGKAYEKFNAIRPDNFDEFTKALKSGNKGDENKFNKKFGVYYTPREIVHYMCKQSLINYLFTRAEEAELSGAIKKQDIEDLIEVGEMITEHEATALIKQEKIKNGIQKSTEYTALLSDNVRENAAAIDNWLAEITVCDPAVGSGAFPVGMMNEIVRARNVLSVFLNDSKRNDYEFKRRCIEHSLYGVDIDPGAVEIAKLRLWLSLVVDEEDIKNIKPLPNLDYRIMQGNSLISEFMGIKFDTEQKKEETLLKDETDELIEQFQQKKDEFLNESNVTQKAKLKDEVENLLVRMFETKLKTQIAEYFNKLKDIENKYSVLPNQTQREELINQEKEKLNKKSGFDLKASEEQLKEFTSGRKIKPFFLWNLYFSEVFHEKGGFDVVIANPPYGLKFSNQEKANLCKYFTHSIKGKFESYRIFIERGVGILKEGALLTYVVPNTWMYIEQSKPLRKFLLNNFTFKHIIQFSQKAFQAAVDSIAFLIIKHPPDANKNKVKVIEIPLSATLGHFNKYLSSSSFYSQLKWRENSNFIITYGRGEKARDLINKLCGRHDKLSDHVILRQGLIPYLTKQDGKDNKYISKKKRGKGWEKYLDGSRLVGRYNIMKNYSYILYGNNLYAPREPWIFEKPRIIFQLIRNISLKRRIVATYIEEKLYSDRNTGLMFSNDQSELDLKFILAIFNSIIMNFVHSFNHNSTYISFPSIEFLPIPNCDKKIQSPFIDLVDKILAITKDADYLQNPAKQAQGREYEKQIDRMVYDLYDLTEEEIRIVEGEAK